MCLAGPAHEAVAPVPQARPAYSRENVRAIAQISGRLRNLYHY